MPAIESPLDILKAAGNLRILCVGDLMLDRFVYGAVSRISPEAPVPILNRSREAIMPGGAGNVARNLAALGAHAVLIGVVGDDTEGRELAELIGQIKGVDGDLIAMRGRPTTLKTRFVAGSHQLLRVDAEDAGGLDPATETEIIKAIQEEAPRAAAILLSDYAKGVLTDKVIAAAIDAAKAAGIPIAVDPKTRDFGRYGAVDVIKPNAGELSLATNMPTETDADVAHALITALESASAKAIIVTRAAKGMSYAQRGNPPQHKSGKAREVYDVSGAGDTSMAALGLGLAAGGALDQATALAIAASGVAVGKAGTAAVTGDEVRAALELGMSGGGVSATNLETLLLQIDVWREAGLTVGFTNGCFDILHPGHLKLLEEAKARCGRLVVGLNSDASVARLKGPKRPVNTAISRARVLKGLTAVDAVIVFEEDTPANLIANLKPDVLVKGGDYTVETIVGADQVIRDGGQVHIVPLVDGQSTSAAIARAQDPVK